MRQRSWTSLRCRRVRSGWRPQLGYICCSFYPFQLLYSKFPFTTQLSYLLPKPRNPFWTELCKIQISPQTQTQKAELNDAEQRRGQVSLISLSIYELTLVSSLGVISLLSNSCRRCYRLNWLTLSEKQNWFKKIKCTAYPSIRISSQTRKFNKCIRIFM